MLALSTPIVNSSKSYYGVLACHSSDSYPVQPKYCQYSVSSASLKKSTIVLKSGAAAENHRHFIHLLHGSPVSCLTLKSGKQLRTVYAAAAAASSEGGSDKDEENPNTAKLQLALVFGLWYFLG